MLILYYKFLTFDCEFRVCKNRFSLFQDWCQVLVTGREMPEQEFVYISKFGDHRRLFRSAVLCFPCLGFFVRHEGSFMIKEINVFKLTHKTFVEDSIGTICIAP